MKDFTELVDLASERLGGKVLAANDEFFAPKENLLKPSKPVFREGKYTTRGKWMDGWETRRRRTPGHDWCIVRLGMPGVIRGVVVDTSFFKGNHPEQVSLEACDMGHSPSARAGRNLDPVSKLPWVEVLPQTTLRGDAQNSFPIEHAERVTHLRLKIYPDGGVSRLRVHGEVVADRARISHRDFDLAALENGGKVIASSDQFFNVPLNLLMPGRPKNMGDGWETRRRRGPGHDWVIVKLGVPGTIRRSRPPRGLVESVFKAKKYELPLLALQPFVAGGFAVAYVASGRFNPAQHAMVLAWGGDLEAPLGAQERRAYQKGLAEVTKATAEENPGREGASWHHLLARGRLRLNQEGRPTLEVRSGESVVEVGITRGNVSNFHDGPSREVLQELLGVRLREELRGGGAPKASQAEMESDWKLLKMVSANKLRDVADHAKVAGSAAMGDAN